MHQTAQPTKTVQWDTPSEAFNAWWDGEYNDSTNPFTKDSIIAYWAFAGWQAALAQPAQREWVMQREWVDLTDEEIDKWTPEIHGVIREVIAQLKERNA